MCFWYQQPAFDLYCFPHFGQLHPPPALLPHSSTCLLNQLRLARYSFPHFGHVRSGPPESSTVVSCFFSFSLTLSPRILDTSLPPCTIFRHFALSCTILYQLVTF